MQHQAAGQFVLIIIILLLGLYLRAHNITMLPVFTDETLHIRRASTIYDFQQHPAVESNGKFLFYFLPGIFDLKQGDTALHLARTIVALTALITGALIFRISKLLFGTGMAALLFYMLVPFAVFFERMALADPFAGLMGAALVWVSLRFARCPSHKRALWVGLFVALTPAAKLSMAFVCLMPLIAVLLFAQYDSPRDLLRRYTPYGLCAAGVVLGFWALILVPAVVEYYTTGRDYVIYPVQLVDTTTQTQTLFQKFTDLWEKMTLLIGLPITLGLLSFIPKLMYDLPRKTIFTVCWLVLAWIPAFVIVGGESFQSRYLMSGVPALAILIGMSLKQLSGGRLWWALLLLGWGFLFALPFAHTAASNPAHLDMPRIDRKDYFAGYYNAYGIENALDYLRENGERYRGRVRVVLGTRFCLLDYEDFADDLNYVCEKKFYQGKIALTQVGIVVDTLLDGGTVYLITDTQPPPDLIQQDLIKSFAKPYGDIQIYIWRLSPGDFFQRSLKDLERILPK